MYKGTEKVAFWYQQMNGACLRKYPYLTFKRPNIYYLCSEILVAACDIRCGKMSQSAACIMKRRK
jgi:hypothetical protein